MSCLRFPHTLQEHRANAAFFVGTPAIKAEFGICPKIRRLGKGKLPTAWDDINRSQDHSWKEHRRKQYRVVRVCC